MILNKRNNMRKPKDMGVVGQDKEETQSETPKKQHKV
jgi:hypothetical protein